MVIALAIGLIAGGVVGALLYARVHDRSTDTGLTVDEIERLRRAELTLADAGSPEAAARELGKQAMALLNAPAAIVLIEWNGVNARMEVGDTTGHSVYDPGSRQGLFTTDGEPSGSIAVAARPDGPYTARDERILDALGQRVSSTLHRLALFDAVESEKHTLADVLGSSSDGIFSVGPDLHVRSWNPAMERVTGISATVAVGHHCCSVFKPTDEEGSPLFGSACPGRSGDQIEVLAQLEVANGSTVWINCAYAPMSDGGYVVVARDVTSRKQIEDEKADFLATVSHELRTPLTPIKGFLQTLVRRDREFTDDERHHIYEVLLREEQRLERLVQQLLQATSLDQAEKMLAFESVDWPSVVTDQVEKARRVDPAREINVVVTPDLPLVVADEQLAGQVLANLLSNAAKYSPDGESIGVGVAHDGHRVVTTVADHGPGVAVGDRERIFDKFTRLGDHLTRPQQGVGLGLYIVRRSVEAMGGTVWVDDAKGGGAAFSFSLPAAPTPSSRKPRASIR